MSITFDTPVVFDERNGRILKTYKTMAAAKGAFKRKWSFMPRIMLCTYAEYQETGAITANTMVAVTSLRTGKKVGIRRIDRGTCCDPSTERYWSM